MDEARQKVLEVGIRQAEIVAAIVARKGVDPEEALSEAYLAMCQALEEYDPARDAAVSTWLYRAIYWRMIDRLRSVHGRTNRPRRIPTVPLEYAPAEASCLDDGPDRVDRDDLLSFVASRGPTCRRLVRMAVDGVTIRELAEEAGVSWNLMWRRIQFVSAELAADERFCEALGRR